MLTICSCCKQNKEELAVLPIWETILPTGTSQEFFYDGLCTLPSYKDWIIAHTTVADDGVFREDNRLCAVNAKTKKVDWYFPSDTKTKEYAHFDGKSYLHKNKLFFRYIKDYAETAESNRTTVCLNLDSQEVVWENTENRDLSQAGKSLGNGRDVIGLGSNCFFVQDEKELYCFNLENNSYTRIFTYNSNEQFISSLILSGDNKYLILFCYDYQKKNNNDYSCKNSIHVLEVESFSEVFIKTVLPPTESYNNHLVATGYEKDGVLYVNIDTYLTAIELRGGTQLWAREDYWAHSLTDMFIYENTLIKCGGNATVGYNKDSGNIVYDYRNHGALYATFDGPYTYMVTTAEKLEILETKTGRILDTITCPYQDHEAGFIGSYPTLHGDKMYIMGGRNKLFCYPRYPW